MPATHLALVSSYPAIEILIAGGAIENVANVLGTPGHSVENMTLAGAGSIRLGRNRMIQRLKDFEKGKVWWLGRESILPPRRNLIDFPQVIESNEGANSANLTQSIATRQIARQKGVA